MTARRGIKVRGGSLGAFLCWAVVFADIGTSIYYVPGLLYGRYGARSAIFVAMTMAVFFLLSIKYVEVTWRYPEGGGVVNVASQALHPFAGLLGGFLILVDYFLTAAISTLSGFIYLTVFAPVLRSRVLPLTVAALVALALLNILGVRQSARTTALFAITAAVGQLGVVALTVTHLGAAGAVASLAAVTRGPQITVSLVATGYGAAFLAFSGLESIAQLAPSMREPHRRVASRAVGAIVLTMALTGPLLTLWSTTLLSASADPNQFISVLGMRVGGPVLGDYVAVTGALLLIFASNTAIIGAYHVFVALARMGFLPRVLERRNRWRLTPQWAICVAVAIPVAVVIASRGNIGELGDLYAFGLLGTFVLTCFSLDLVRWRERIRWKWPQASMFVVGVLTTILVAIAWSINLVAKPTATEFGGALTVLGLAVGLAGYAYNRGRRPPVFPVPFRPKRAAESIAAALGSATWAGEILVILPHDQLAAEAVLRQGIRAAFGRGAVFLYRGNRYPHEHHELLEVSDPWLKDYAAKDAFARAERMARASVPHRRFVYVPGNLPRDIVGQIWRALHPRETLVVVDDKDMLPPAAVSRVRQHFDGDVMVLEMFSARVPPPPHRGSAPTGEGNT
ncbi:MAG TPA: APC family permease [Candidatus Dormibacteraeota bacterium]|nr:APC family permease [Candidatus Dormibacteraeota bacterium]